MIVDVLYPIDEYLIYYSISVVLISSFAVFYIQPIFPKQSIQIFIFFILLMIAIPLIGIFVALWIIFYMRIVSYPEEEITYKNIRFDEFFTRFPIVKRQFGESAMYEVMSNENIPLSLRLNALSVLAEHTNKTHFTLIKKMLASSNDEIRLFSFSIVDGLEQEINEKIHHALNIHQGETSSTIEKAKAAQSLASLYWELIYFELADDVLIKYLLGEVEKYAFEALEIFPNEYRLYFLLGKVYFEKKEDDKAKSFFEKAIEVGRLNSVQNIHFIQPYIAEIAYKHKDFVKVKEIIMNTEYFDLNDKLKPIREIWAR